MYTLAGVLLLAGYTLIYAAVARGGMFATDPWMGLMADAYEISVQGRPIEHPPTHH